MPQSKREQQQCILLLSKHLEKLSIARKQLYLQLEGLDAHTRATEQEHNALFNLDTPILNLPDEALAMVFEAGIELDQNMDLRRGSISQF